MFAYKKPCNDCPFKTTQGGRYQLPKARLQEIFNATAFECHKTTGVTGKQHAPQQCAGLMALLHKESKPNTIMQIATRTGYLDPNAIDGSEVYDSLQDCIEGHTPSTLPNLA